MLTIVPRTETETEGQILWFTELRDLILEGELDTAVEIIEMAVKMLKRTGGGINGE